MLPAYIWQEAEKHTGKTKVHAAWCSGPYALPYKLSALQGSCIAPSLGSCVRRTFVMLPLLTLLLLLLLLPLCTFAAGAWHEF
jgi:hypothetical protein